MEQYAIALLRNGCASPSVGLRNRIPTKEEFLRAVPSRLQFEEILHDLRRGMLEYSESTLGRRESPGTETFRNALTVMEQSPEIRELVREISCDGGVWEAILNCVSRHITQSAKYTVNAARAVPGKIVELSEKPRGWFARLWEKISELWEHVKDIHDKMAKKIAQKIATMRSGITSSGPNPADLLPKEKDVSNIIKAVSIGIMIIMVMIVAVVISI